MDDELKELLERIIQGLEDIKNNTDELPGIAMRLVAIQKEAERIRTILENKEQ
jgi:hypothetical protein